MSEWISPAQAAKMLSVHPETLRRRADAAGLSVKRTTGGHRRYIASEIEQLRHHVVNGEWRLDDPESAIEAEAPTVQRIVSASAHKAVDTYAPPVDDAMNHIKQRWDSLPRPAQRLLMLSRSVAGWWLSYVFMALALHLTARMVLNFNPFRSVLIEREGSYDAALSMTFDSLFVGPLHVWWWACVIVTGMLGIKALVVIVDAALGFAHRGRHGHAHYHV